MKFVCGQLRLIADGLPQKQNNPVPAHCWKQWAGARKNQARMPKQQYKAKSNEGEKPHATKVKMPRLMGIRPTKPVRRPNTDGQGEPSW